MYNATLVMLVFLSGVATAMSPMGSDDVLEAKMVLAGAILSYSANIFLKRRKTSVKLPFVNKKEHLDVDRTFLLIHTI